MTDQPSNLIAAVRYFADPVVCNDYMRSIKWPDGNPWLARKLVRVPPAERPPDAMGWSCKCGWWNTDCNHCRKCGASIRDRKTK